MYICRECCFVFEYPKRNYNMHDFSTPPWDVYNVCPNCKDTNISITKECDECGKYITDEFAVLEDGTLICKECYEKDESLINDESCEIKSLDDVKWI